MIDRALAPPGKSVQKREWSVSATRPVSSADIPKKPENAQYAPVRVVKIRFRE